MLIIFTIIWGILFYPIFAIGYIGGTDNLSGIITLIKIIPITIVMTIIGSWIMYYFKKHKIAKWINIIPLINILLVIVLGSLMGA